MRVRMEVVFEIEVSREPDTLTTAVEALRGAVCPVIEECFGVPPGEVEIWSEEPAEDDVESEGGEGPSH